MHTEHCWGAGQAQSVCGKLLGTCHKIWIVFGLFRLFILDLSTSIQEQQQYSFCIQFPVPFLDLLSYLFWTEGNAISPSKDGLKEN